MSKQVKKIFDQILKSEIDEIYIYANAILEPQSEIADQLYNTYEHAISAALHHNYHAESMTIGELDKYNIEIKKIPSFSEFIISKLSDRSGDRYSQLLLNHREQFTDIGLNGYEINYIRFCDNLKLTLQTAKKIANHIETDSYSSADHELARLIERFSNFYPKYKEMFEFKPSFFGLSIDLVAIEENMSTFVRRIRKS
ncbi:hypothetical protein LVV83_22160 [Pseudomonas sp. LM20]|uniref:hypothetical protein n=1 Tax=Pseudomonas sp. LM20 TaxID=2899116 RepID=UPI001F417683|nr:hypothetical protein [Pseudomonas sp. LM20]MCE5989732.1 hypothetical protein [Pseudomonas sp. LM20]